MRNIVPTSVLIVSNDTISCNLLANAITPTGLPVLTATTPSEGIDLLLQNSPDAIILDLGLLEMNSDQFCQKIREFSDRPILVLSDEVDHAKIIKFLDAGVDDFMLKPVALGAMMARLRTLMLSYHRSRRSSELKPTSLPSHRPSGNSLLSG